MKNIISKIFITFCLIFISNTQVSNAEEPGTFMGEQVGGWALVDENNNVLGVHVCTPSVCGDPNSTYSQLALKPGQKYVLQTAADPVTGNVAGWGQSTYDPATNLFLLPGGGTLVGGSLVEGAVFPKYATPEGNYYERTIDYIWAETDFIEKKNSVLIDLPNGIGEKLKYSVSFDPKGIEKTSVVKTGFLKPEGDIKVMNKKVNSLDGVLKVNITDKEGNKTTLKFKIDN
jgi:hypothetical protein